MKNASLDLRSVLILGLLILAAFALGRYGGGAPKWEDPDLSAVPLHRGPLIPQGRRVGTPGKPKTGRKGVGRPAPAEGLFLEGHGGGVGWAGDLIAVTGSYGVGTSVLYVIDARTKHLAVYEARGGSRQGRRLVLVGARRIDLDLRLEGYNDESEYTFPELAKRFRKQGLLDEGEAETPVTPGGSDGGGKDSGGGR